MAEERVALNLRLPASLHQGLVALAKREYRSLNDQILTLLARAVLDALDPRRDTWHQIVAQTARRLEPFASLWNMRYPEKPSEPKWRVPIIYTTHTTFGEGHTILDPAQLERRAAQDRLERACAELLRAYHAWEELDQQHSSPPDRS
jgi:hypothetical protein